ncbi:MULTISPECIES: hypothetical protein [unclassified Microbacterium]|uniref:hypothetical protein n=1 Tax=unclassified Microbacterium TaxID=2609290 RepID=UPI00109C3291|nr:MULTISPECIES: hypothetical protein [unclassified Microbacterium]
MINTRTSALVVATTLAVGSLVGCAGTSTPASTPSGGSTPTATATTTPSPTAEPRVEDPADPATWIIDEAGVGPIDVGGDFTSTLGGLAGPWANDTANCSWSAWWMAADSAYGVSFVRGTESEAAPIREISVYSAAETPAVVPGPVTEVGLGIGATKAEVLAAYPDAQEGVSTIGSDTWIMLPSATDAHVYFAFRENSDTAWDVTVTTGAEPSYEVCG